MTWRERVLFLGIFTVAFQVFTILMLPWFPAIR